MDWTGGARRRFTPGKRNATVQKQKAHFAKVRASLQHTQVSQRLFKPEFSKTVSSQRASLSHERCRDTSAKNTRYGRPAEIPHTRLGPEQPNVAQDRRWSYTKELLATPRKKGQRQPSSQVFDTSKGRRKPKISPFIHRRAKCSRESQIRPLPIQNDTTEEETLLMANRHRLLGRSDWLGLVALRPVQMAFPSSRSKDRIGRRRKIHRFASQRGEPAGQRLLTPLFEHHLAARDHMMSGAIVPDNIQIKVGTDALLSQTERSRHYHTPGKTSVRHPSTESGPLSEESMLLGEDADAVEDFGSPWNSQHVIEAGNFDLESSAVLGRGPRTRDVQQVPESPQMQVISGALESNSPKCMDLNDEMLELTRGQTGFVPNSEHFENLNPCAERVVVGTPADCQRSNITSGDVSQPEERFISAMEDDVVATEFGRDDKVWRDLMKIKRQSHSHASVAALKSSSMHITTSDNSDRPVLGINTEKWDEDRRSVSTPKGAGTQASMLHHSHYADVGDSSPRTSTVPQTPPTPMRQIISLAKQPPRPAPRVEEEAHDNALWRQFIIGSPRSFEDPLQSMDDRPLYFQSNENAVGTNAHSSLFAVSGLGTSDKSTIGNSVFTIAERPLAISQATSNPRARKSVQSHQDQPAVTISFPRSLGSADDSEQAGEEGDVVTKSPIKTNVKSADMIAPVSSLGTKRISVGDSDLPTDDARPLGNVHASPANILPPKRFKPPKKHIMAPIRTQSRILHVRETNACSGKQTHSIYDLVDSDGVSIA